MSTSKKQPPHSSCGVSPLEEQMRRHVGCLLCFVLGGITAFVAVMAFLVKVFWWTPS